MGLSAICAAAARNGINDLDLFAVLADNEMTDEDGAVHAGTGALVLVVVIVIAVNVIVVEIVMVVILIFGGWVRGCARLLSAAHGASTS